MELIPYFKFEDEVAKKGMKQLKIVQKHPQGTKCNYCNEEYGTLLNVILYIANSAIALTVLITFILSAW
jgi:hypothetical protein